MEHSLEIVKVALGLSKGAYVCSATPYGLVYSIIAMAVTVVVISAILWRRPLRRPSVSKAVVN